MYDCMKIDEFLNNDDIKDVSIEDIQNLQDELLSLQKNINEILNIYRKKLDNIITQHKFLSYIQIALRGVGENSDVSLLSSHQKKNNKIWIYKRA